MHKVVLSLLLLCSCGLALAGERCKVFEVNGSKERFEWVLNAPFTGLSFQGLAEGLELEVLIDGKGLFALEEDLHVGPHTSHLILPRESFTTVVLLNPTGALLKGSLACYDGSYDDITRQKMERVQAAYKKAGCDLPPVIDQDVWRKDLQEPEPNPAVTDVQHLVVHHSATTNDVNDYLLAVRNIYLFHVNSNGWDDVGYNFLIDPNGVLYAGRDGQGADDDDIRGAHFCAKNSNTMGVCLIGNYSEIPPTDTMLGTLAHLLAWKTKKEALQPLASSFHPSGSSTGFILPAICGHRDGYKEGVYAGCNTECPGNYTYDLMDTVRSKVVDLLMGCDYVVGHEVLEPHLFSVLSLEGALVIKPEHAGFLQVFDALGRNWFDAELEALSSKAITLPKGMYVLYFEDAQGTRWQKALVR